MRTLLALIAASAMAVCATAQTPAPTQPSSAPPPGARASNVVELENPADGAKVTLKRGGELKLVLDANPTYGLQWETPTKIAPTLSPIGTRILIGKSVNTYDYTAGAWNVFRFRAEQPGKLTLNFELRKPGEPGPASKSVKYDVTVE